MSDGPVKSRALRGTSISVAAQITKLVLRLGSNLLLTRLLFPEAFGTMAVLNTIVIGLAMVSDLGVQTSIIQHPRGDDPDFLDTAWSVQVGRGAVLWLIGVALAFPLAALYEDPQLRVLIPASTLGAVIQGFESTKLSNLHRHIRLGPIVVVELAAQLAGIVVMALLAWWWKSVWALVVGTLTNSLVLMALTHLALPGHRNRFRWEPEAARALLGFGAWIFVSTLITFFAIRLDIFLLRKLVPVALLGVYSIATMLSQLPNSIGGPVTNAVLLPALSEASREHHSRLATDFEKARRVILPIGLFVTLGPVLLGPAFFDILYDDRYHEAGWMCQLSMAVVWFVYLSEAWSRALLAVGDSRSLALSNLVKLGVTAGGCLLGYELYALPGFIVGAAVGSASGHAVVLYFLAKHGLHSARLDAAYSLLGLCIGLAGAGLPPLATRSLGFDRSPWLDGLFGLLLLLPLGLWAAEGVLRQLRTKPLH